MKKLIFILTVLFISVGFSQNYWSSETDINFFVQSNTIVTSFVDQNGVHIVYSRNGGIRYALVNSNGGVIKYDKVIESEGAGTNHANVVAFGNDVYAVYYKNDDIKVARSTNLGDTWNNTFSSRDLVNTGCNKILAYKYDALIYIVWSEVRVSGWGYDSHFIKFTPSGPSWSEYKNITDNEEYGGDEPDLTFSPDRVHVSFIKYQFDEPKTRDRSSGTWQASQSVPFNYLPYTTNLRKGKPIISSNYLNEMYRADYASIGTEGSYIGHSYRSLGSSTWNQNNENLFTPVNKIHVVNNTLNNRIHIIYYDEQAVNYVHKYLTGTTYSGVIANVPLFEQSSFLSSNSNDLYLLRVSNPDYPSKIKFRHYDDAPLAPTGLAVNPYQQGNVQCAKLTWQLNNEPDVFVKTYNAYQVERRIKFLDNPWGPWTVVYSPGGSISQFIDSEVQGAGSGESYFAEYRMRALDNNNHYSAYSSTVMIEFLKFIHNSPGNNGSNATNKVNNSGSAALSYNYELSQNYPNPFNPTTTISYSIKNAGEVSLKVYDMLGTEVASFVNENQEAGNYSITFNAAELPSRSGSALTSGIYFYTLTSGNFMETKKLILLK